MTVLGVFSLSFPNVQGCRLEINGLLRKFTTYVNIALYSAVAIWDFRTFKKDPESVSSFFLNLRVYRPNVESFIILPQRAATRGILVYILSSNL